MKKKVFSHITFWTLYYCINAISSKIQAPSSFYIQDSISKYSLAILFFYMILFLFKKNKIFLFILPAIIYLTFSYLLYQEILPFISSYPKTAHEWVPFFVKSFWWMFHYAIYAFFYWYYHKTIKQKEALAKLQAEYAQLQLLQAQTQYNFLQAQINPHFLYNTLNMFYGQTAQVLPKTAQGIMYLTEIMRYSLSVGSPNGKLLLQDEIQQMHNYIALQQLRFNNQLQITFTTQGNFDDLYMPPHIFLTFVENAIKHGDTDDANNPIKITLTNNDTYLTFTIKNKKSPRAKEAPGTGVGVQNVVDRMQLQYKEAFIFTNNTNEDFYDVALQLKVTALTADK
jgi:two-component system, LytTR family, sensor kinase